jgi:hypothetical protein
LPGKLTALSLSTRFGREWRPLANGRNRPKADLQPAEFRHDENITCLLTIKQIQTLGVQCRQRCQ